MGWSDLHKITASSSNKLTCSDVVIDVGEAAIKRSKAVKDREALRRGKASASASASGGWRDDCTCDREGRGPPGREGIPG